MRDKIKEQLIKLFEGPDWEQQILEYSKGSSFRTDVIWVLTDFVRDGKYIDESMILAERFIDDSDPTVEDEVNQKLIKGEEVHYIVTTRGSLTWLVGAIIARLDTDYYTRAINLVERLATDPVYYVRAQATFPLAGLMQNIRAYQNKDGSKFNFTESDRERVMKLAFQMISDNKGCPRVMEYLVNVFDKARFLSEEKAMVVIKGLLYDNENKIYPDYVTTNMAPLLMYYAEFAKDQNLKFKNEQFQALLKDVIIKASARLKSTIIWHTWKTIDDSKDTYARFKPYISLFFEGDFQQEILSQSEFLIEKILQISPQDAVKLFITEINYIKRGLLILPPNHQIWFHNAEELVEKVAELEPERLPDILWTLKEVSRRTGWIGDIQRIFSSFKKASPALQQKLAEEIKPLYEELQHFHRGVLPPI